MKLEQHLIEESLKKQDRRWFLRKFHLQMMDLYLFGHLGLWDYNLFPTLKKFLKVPNYLDTKIVFEISFLKLRYSH